MCERKVLVALDEGLHARPAARIVKLSKTFTAAIEIAKGDVIANGKSAVKIMLLGAKQGQEVIVRATGSDAEQAVAAISALIAGVDKEEAAHTATPHVKNNSGLQVERVATSTNQTRGLLSGIGASAGIAVGAAFLYIPEDIRAQAETIAEDCIPAALAQFKGALAIFIERMQAESAALAVDHPGREILTALLNLAHDPELVGTIESRISQGQDPVFAILATSRELSASFRALGDGYFTARADDIEEIARQISAHLLGLPMLDATALQEPRIIVASTIGVIEFSRLPADRILGLVCLDSAATSHLAILARSLGIPAVLGLQTSIEELRQVHDAALDGGAGFVAFNPDQMEVQAFLQEAADIETERAVLARYIDMAPRTQDGVEIEIAANLNLPIDVQAALKNGAMGIGLLRTEFLFMQRRSLPSEEEQYGVYAAIARSFGARPVVIRTLDVGGDKPLPSVNAVKEENPALGYRGVRLCLDHPALFKPQLRALLRAATIGNIKIMIPMVADVDEIRQVKRLIIDCTSELSGAGIDARIPEIGIMVETPAAVMCAAELAEEVAFFSIGTNDLTQYVMAVDRMHKNPRLTRLCRASHPAVLRMIELTCRAAKKKGIWVGVCGEAAGDPALIPTLLSYGVTEFSMEPSLIPRAKKLVMESRTSGTA